MFQNRESGSPFLIKLGIRKQGINLFPGGGFVESGSPDSPTYIGLASGAAIVIEKADSGGLISQIGGKLLFFQE